MIIAKKTANAFDVLLVAETSASISRTKDNIQLSWINEVGQLERYRKTSVRNLQSGCLLRLSGNYLIGTNSKSDAVGILLADFNTNAQTKTIGNHTAKLLPITVL